MHTQPSSPAPSRAATAAVTLLARYPADLSMDVLLDRVCRDEGITVLDADLRDIAGVLRQEAGRWRIYLSRQDAPHRQRLTLAHLIGHYVLHATPGRSFVARMDGDACGWEGPR